MLEEQLLEDPQQLAFAVEPGAAGGQEAWVAVFAKSLLQPPLAALEQAGVHVERVLPLGAPDGPTSGHVQGSEETPLLRLCTAQGVSQLPLAGSLARALLPAEPCRYSAEPALVGAAERWLGSAVAPLSRAERALAALGTGWELRQFELAPHARGLQRLGQAWRAMQTPAWRPLRWGAVALLGVQLLGLNLVAWQQRRHVEAQRAAIVQTVREAHPQLRALLDAPLQMRRETELLRARAGQPGEQDLEILLAAAARA
jgi:general secretion pathway protein L